MTTMTDPPGQGFRLSQLIYDTRYRSLTIQVVAMILLMLLVSWLVANTVTNLHALGKDFDFGFLTQPSGYDINQRLIAYDSQSTHGRAAVVGILNTLLVAVLGCALATVLGVVAGVLRLSNNWLVSRLMAVYVEGFRNVPLLLWIVLIFALMSESTPAPSAFRGDTPSASMLLDGVAVTNRGIYIPAIHFGAPFFDNGLYNWLIVLIAFAASVFAVKRLSRWAAVKQEATGDRPTTWYLTLGILVLPVAILFALMGAFLDLPSLQGFNFQGGIHLRGSLIALWLALSLYTGAFIAEIVRGGILAVSKGQSEAAFALGLRPGTTMKLVVLPQALRVIIPPLISQFLNLTKNSSLAIAVGYMDARSTLGGITINQTGRELEGMLLLGLFYLVLSLVISGAMNVYNTSVKLKER
ncbi:amino acid ABC transporter permease [Salipiger aestuarii]|uniref:General L-amino acid transport system permease protein n=1 Tax=Salipiger aestuarii TaxID=568098 RepID=A0A327XX96_9RHOB|nr:ABC transporter permease subunit [Salipiger aestuarii]EIE49417.1 glutamate/glutamine/aspartate/asparagine ABC transporter, permease protein [Citreicella sp. 357]KAA8606465.1 amino acid ABC transporter permease [Salipiger aestuarii]KAA8609628.1 amino acid ABC transporter permease [Salipiger aestuarii]KAB2541044.1 amino acid ABC transporter permease [Salipiger aestuarii]RAK13254.1 general L-amino acid transport system permease protein [Salipiger aestuarii]